MRTGFRLPSAEALPASAEDKAERRRMSFYALFFLAAGGVVGSGWLLGGAQADQYAGSWAVFSWLIGGALMLVIAAVMVELSTAVPKTGGLVFLPLQSGGPLLATVVAAGVWVYYSVTPASESTAMVRGLAASNWRGLVNASGEGLTWGGIAWAALFMLLIAAVNLLGPRLFLMVNNVLTAFKILVPLLIIALLAYAEVHPPSQPLRFASSTAPIPAHYDFGSVLSTVTTGAVMYAYLGFQGPLDFAGNVRRRGIGEAARLRWAVYATVCGSIFLYVSLQFVVIYIRHRSGSGAASGATESTYAAFARAVAPGWAAPLASWLIKLDTVLSPAGSAVVYTYVLTREVAALSRAHLTHRGLQKSKYSVVPLANSRLRKAFGDDRLDLYWLILVVDLFVSGIWLLCFGGNWTVLSDITSILALVVYATPIVVLASLRSKDKKLFPGRRYSILPEAGFVSIAVIFFLTGWDNLWQGMAALTVGCLLLFGLPLVVPASRWYDAKAHATQFRRLRTSPSARAAAVLFGYFTLSMFASLVVTRAWPTHPAAALWSAIPLAVLAVIAFRWLVTLSVRYMAEHPPTLPTPVPAAKPVTPAPSSPRAVTEQSG